MKWVKAGERLPEKLPVCGRWYGPGVLPGSTQWYWTTIKLMSQLTAGLGNTVDFADEWLDESPEPQTGEQDKLREALIDVLDLATKWDLVWFTKAEWDRLEAARLALAAPPVQAENKRYCATCHNKGFIDGIEHACPECNPGGEWRNANAPYDDLPGDSPVQAGEQGGWTDEDMLEAYQGGTVTGNFGGGNEPAEEWLAAYRKSKNV